MIKAQLIAQSIKQEVLYSVGEKCTSLPSGTSLDEPSFSQYEADTIPLPESPTSHVASFNPKKHVGDEGINGRDFLEVLVCTGMP